MAPQPSSWLASGPHAQCLPGHLSGPRCMNLVGLGNILVPCTLTLATLLICILQHLGKRPTRLNSQLINKRHVQAKLD